jgi:hypothetical protein
MFSHSLAIAMYSNGTPHNFANLANRWPISSTLSDDVEFGFLRCSIPEIPFQYHMQKFNQLKDVKCNVAYFN